MKIDYGYAIARTTYGVIGVRTWINHGRYSRPEGGLIRMPLLPNNVKFRKQHTRSYDLEHIATRGNSVAFGEYGIQALEGGEITSRQIEAARVTAATGCSVVTVKCGSASSRTLRSPSALPIPAWVRARAT